MVLQLLQLGHYFQPVQLLSELVVPLAVYLTADKQHSLDALQHRIYLLRVTGVPEYVAQALKQPDLVEELCHLVHIALVGGIGEDVADLGAYVGQVCLQHGHQLGDYVLAGEDCLNLLRAAGGNVS